MSMVSARLQGSPFGSSKRKNSRLVSEEDREHLRQILEKELEEKEQKAREPRESREPTEPSEHNPQPPVSTVSTVSTVSPGTAGSFADDLTPPAVSSTIPTLPVSTVSTVLGGGNPVKTVEIMETVESDGSSVGSLPPLDSFLEDSAVKGEKPKISTVTTFSTIPNASNSMEEGQISSDEERTGSLLEQFEKEMGISGIPKKDPISQSLELPDGMNEMGLYVDETPAPNPLSSCTSPPERFPRGDGCVQRGPGARPRCALGETGKPKLFGQAEIEAKRRPRIRTAETPGETPVPDGFAQFRGEKVGIPPFHGGNGVVRRRRERCRVRDGRFGGLGVRGDLGFQSFGERLLADEGASCFAAHLLGKLCVGSLFDEGQSIFPTNVAGRDLNARIQ